MNRVVTTLSRRLAGLAAAAVVGLSAAAMWPHPAPALSLRDQLQPRQSSAHGVTSVTWTKPFVIDDGLGTTFSMGKVPAGHYIATIDMWVAGTTADNAFRCDLRQRGRDLPIMLANGVPLGDNPTHFALSETRLVKVAPGKPLFIGCYGAQVESYRSYANLPLQVTFTRVDDWTKRPLGLGPAARGTGSVPGSAATLAGGR